MIDVLSLLAFLADLAGKLYRPASDFIFDQIAKHQKYKYYFKRYEKKLTVYRDGHGILINSFIIRIIDSEAIGKFDRWLNIEDSCKSTKFIPIQAMLRQKKVDRFTSMGMWYDGSGFVKRPRQITCTDKLLEWKFIFDKNKIKHNATRDFELSYAISIPGMFPIKAGRFWSEQAPLDNYNYTSSLEVKHKIRKLVYIISLDAEIEIEKHPIFTLIPASECVNSKTLKCEDDSDLFYNRFKTIQRNPCLRSKIKVNWKVAH